MTPPADRKLSKDEVAALVEHIEKKGEAAPERPEEPRRVESYDFFRPSRFTRSELEKLRRININLASRAGLNASRLMRSAVKAQLVSVEQMKWQSILDEIGEGSVGFGFEMTPLEHRGVVTMKAPFAGSCLDRMMGGEGAAKSGEGGFTDLEAKIFRRFVLGMVAPLPDLWRDVGKFEIQLGAYAQDVQSIGIFPPGEDMFELVLLMQSEMGSGQVAIAVPFDVVRSLSPSTVGPRQTAATSPEAVQAALRDNLQMAPLAVSAVLGTAEIGVRRLLTLEPGDVLMLGTNIEDPLDVRINDKVKAWGYPGIARGRVSVKLIET